jgi:hypothetical protein
MYLALGRIFAIGTKDGQTGLILCAIGLVAVFVTGYIGYFVVDRIWPSFYYTPINEGKNVWLGAQALSVALYLLGIISVLFDVRRITSQELQP